MIVKSEEINFYNEANIWADKYYNLNNIIHYHEEVEFIYIKKGSLKFYINSSCYTAKKGDIVICNSGDVHCIESIGDSICDILIFGDDIIKSFATDYILENFISNDQLKNIEAEKFIKNIIYELNGQNAFYMNAVCGQIINFFAILYRNFGKIKTTTVKFNKSYQNLISYIDLNYDKVTFSEAANIMHYTKAYFSKVFKDISGMTFTNYLNRIRIEKAVLKIKENSGNITEIANECGFSTIRHFNRTFREITGTAPSKITNSFIFTTNSTKVSENMKTQQYNNNKL